MRQAEPTGGRAMRMATAAAAMSRMPPAASLSRKRRSADRSILSSLYAAVMPQSVLKGGTG